jgi:CAAX prenyl protease-like protein
LTLLSAKFLTAVASLESTRQFGENSALAWLMIVTRILGSTLVVPPLEEVFYRSFLYRYIAKPDFLSVPLNRFLPLPFLATAAVFGFSHNEWLAGILCGAAYQWLVLRKNRLGDAMTAHAITNFLLGVWIVWRARGIFGKRMLDPELVRNSVIFSRTERITIKILLRLDVDVVCVRAWCLPAAARLASASL